MPPAVQQGGPRQLQPRSRPIRAFAGLQGIFLSRARAAEPSEEMCEVDDCIPSKVTNVLKQKWSYSARWRCRWENLLLQSYVSGIDFNTAHAMLPAAASASNTAVEDAAALAECISACAIPEELKAAVQAYEAIRKPRNDRIWEISWISQHNVSSYTATSYEDAVDLRNERLKRATDELAQHLKLSSEDRKTLQTSQVSDEAAVYPSPALLKWLYGYDAIATVRLILGSQHLRLKC